MEQLFGYEQVARWIVNIRLTFVLFALVSGSVVFAGHRGFFGGGIEGRQRKEASVREWMQSGMFLRFCGVDVVEGRQRKVASLRAGTPSGDTTRAP